MSTMKVKVIGLGGIGSILIENLARYFQYRDESWHLHLIDGDSYESKNRERQIFNAVGGNKADTKREELERRYDNIIFSSTSAFVNKSNIDELICEHDIIFCCVDNHTTRKMVSDKVKTLQDCILISGGNDLIDGNVQIYIRKGGEDVTPSLVDYHPEIQDPRDKHPEEASCEELSKSAPQIFFTNLTVATIMCWVIYNIMTDGTDHIKSEVYFDMKMMALNAVTRKVKD